MNDTLRKKSEVKYTTLYRINLSFPVKFSFFIYIYFYYDCFFFCWVVFYSNLRLTKNKHKRRHTQTKTWVREKERKRTTTTNDSAKCKQLYVLLLENAAAADWISSTTTYIHNIPKMLIVVCIEWVNDDGASRCVRSILRKRLINCDWSYVDIQTDRLEKFFFLKFWVEAMFSTLWS